MRNLVWTSRQKAQQLSDQFEQEKREWRRKRNRTLKVLVLGPSGSGKSTLIKHIRMRMVRNTEDLSERRPGYAAGIPDDERRACKLVAIRDVIQAMRHLVEEARLVDSKDGELRRHVETLLQHPADIGFKTLPPGLVEAIGALWGDECIRKAFEKCREENRGPHPSIQHFFEKLPEFAQEEYIPNNDDMLQHYAPTPGIQETIVPGGEWEYRFIEVRTHGTEKWLRQLELDDADSAIVLAPMSDYEGPPDSADGGLPSALQQSIDTFAYLQACSRCNPVIMCANRADEFKAKIAAGVPLAGTFPDYEGPGGDYRAAWEHILQVFDRMTLSGRACVHTMNASDTPGMRDVVDALFYNFQDRNAFPCLCVDF